jgi:cytidylate kinase
MTIAAVKPDKKKIIVAIDGPSGAGKSTLAKLLAQRLGYVNIDTGAMFRAVALMAERAGVPPDDEIALANLCKGLTISFDFDCGSYKVLANGEDVTSAIRTPEISLLTSVISTKKPVRDFLLGLQRSLGEQGGVVLEGRDIGTVVFPSAQAKFFLSASIEKRAERRHKEIAEKGSFVTLQQTVAEVNQRDEQDEKREHAPLCQAADAVLIDSTSLTLEEVLEKMTTVINEITGER